jgi:diacylglycerol O-acyltransferase / wax synthase
VKLSTVPVQLTPMESIMWRVGQDPTLRMTLGALLIVDRPPTPTALTERLAFAATRAPRLCQRPDEPSTVRGRPAWIDDADPSPDAHLRSLSVAAPGSRRQVLDLVGLLEAIPFDTQRSPWDLTLIEGLEGGRAALYLRAHHVLTDGVAGLRLLGLLLDEAAWPRVVPTDGPKPAVGGDARTAAASERPLGTFTVTIDVPRTVRRFIHGVNSARDIAPLDTAVHGLQRVLGLANSVSRQLMVTGGPLAARPEGRSLLSRFELFSVDGARTAALALGGSRNDLLVAAAAAGLGRYHERIGTPAAELRLATPTGQGHADELGGNWFAPARLEVPTAVGRPGPQFGIVAERLAQARREPALRVASQVAATLGRLPPRVLLPALRAQAESVDFAATALPGLRGDRRICGSLIEEGYPLGPRLGCPMNITALGNADRLDVGLALDPSAFADPELLVGCLTEAFAGYVAAAGDGVPTRSD